MAQRWMILDGFNHEGPRALDAGLLHLWLEVVGDIEDVDAFADDD
jgi:hypothetical protein